MGSNRRQSRHIKGYHNLDNNKLRFRAGYMVSVDTIYYLHYFVYQTFENFLNQRLTFIFSQICLVRLGIPIITAKHWHNRI